MFVIKNDAISTTIYNRYIKFERGVKSPEIYIKSLFYVLYIYVSINVTNGLIHLMEAVNLMECSVSG